MTNHIHSLKLILIAGLGSFALTACVPGQYAYDTGPTGAEFGQYGAGFDQYGAQSGQYGGAYGANFAQTNIAQTNFAQTRYGDVVGASGLRPACNVQAAPCGFMTVVPVYPIYQIAAEREPVVEIFNEPPVVEIFEPEPEIYIEPEPVYEPMDHWPEPAAPVQSWKPIRK